MNDVGITPRAVFALRPEIKRNAHFITDFQILYPAGSVLVLQNYYEKRQKHINLYGKSAFLEAIEISPSRKLAAIILNAERGQIIVYDMHTLRKRRTLNLPPDSTTNRFETVSFTHDDLYILAITGEPDWNLVLYNWEKGKLTSSSKAIITSNPATVVQICCSPTENTEICLIGQGLFRLLSRMETVWRQYGFQKADQINITSGTWLTSNAILCGTMEGKILVIENGDLKGIYNAFTVNMISLKDKDESSLTGTSSLLLFKTPSEGQENEDFAVRAVTSFSKGFAYSCRSGYVHFFEKETPVKYRRRNVFRIPKTDLLHLSETQLNIIRHLSINVSQDKILATTNRAQIYTIRLWGPEINVAPELFFKILGEPLHHGAINGLSMCLWKPYFATSGLFDRTIRLWDYETETVQIVKNFLKEIRCIDLHPTGNFIAIGFDEVVDFSVVLMNDIQSYRRLPVLECNICRFSWYGQYLALVYRSVIDVYDTIMLKSVFSLKDHGGRINAMQWLTEDKKMVSCSSQGEIFIWDMIDGVKLEEIRMPEVSYLDIAISSDMTRLYAVDSNGVLQVFGKHSQEPVMLINIHQLPLEKVLLSRSNLMMFLTAGQNGVLSAKMPLANPPEYSEFIYHSSKIEQMKLSYNDQTLVTVSAGGAVIIWRLNLPEGKTVPLEKNIIHTSEILINKPELQKKILTIKDLSQKLQGLELDQLKEVRETETEYGKKMNMINDNYSQNIRDLKEKTERTEADQNKALLTIQNEIAELKEKQIKEKEDLVENYTKKLLVEYEKVRSLETLKEETVNNFENMVAELEESKERETKELIAMYEEKLAEVNCLLQETYEKNQKNIREHETLKQQIEEDTDRELVETMAKYEGLLKEEKERNALLKDEAMIMRKKHAEAQKEKNNFRERLENLQAELSKRQTNIQALEKDVADLKVEILERDTAAEEKDEKIFQLKKQIQELDKFKFVLEYKIKELRKEIDPKTREIREKNEQIADMEIEQDNLKKINSSLELQLTELKEKINGTEKEIDECEKKYRNGVNAMRQIRVDIYFLYQELNDPKKLKDGIGALNQKYLNCDIANKEQYGESDLERELLIEREFLEKTIKALKSTLLKNLGKKFDKAKVVKDNVVLLEELNSVRRELTDAVTMVKNLENLIGFKPQKVIVPSEAFNKLEMVLKKQKKIKQTYQMMISDAAKETNDLEIKMSKMQEKLSSLLHSEM